LVELQERRAEYPLERAPTRRLRLPWGGFVRVLPGAQVQRTGLRYWCGGRVSLHEAPAAYQVRGPARGG